MSLIKNNVSKTYRYSFWGMVTVSALYAFIMLPIYASVSSNVVFMRSAIPELVNYLAKVIEIIGISIGYAMAAYATYRMGKSAACRVYAVYCGAAFIKYFVSQTVLWVNEGGIPAFNNGFFGELLWLVVLPFALEVIQFTVFYLICANIIGKSCEKTANVNLDLQDAKSIECDKGIYPIGKIFNFKNPMLKCARAGGLVVLISKVLLTTIDEIYLTVQTRPIKTFDEALTCILRYLSDCVCGAMAYFVMVFALITFFDMLYKKNSESKES